ncbi:cupin domain-containing protein [Catenovulum sp. 2E275]|uniref:cupin domain-containing protein n=1 Tax=Catenovulum sp. 2E275 TaxID=2980497 RepID=UPI0021D236DD|nr:cupin domain-containing protein [Catenovulum sp. 2E275]MCU4674559.1 cupin domain-containing protein [Catenovulum sp. 2E275]
MTYQLFNFSEAEFLNTYWQKKPVLIKGAFKNFIDPLDADELAGLAMEEEVESRLICKQANKWQVEHGPFEDYSHLPETDWTLLVQAVDHWSTEAAALMSPFRFIPNWRIDDLMVSFSMPGGGVGAHVDQYDVFILQGQGKRHWKVGAQQKLTEKVPHPDLLQITGFDACIDDILEPGDLLYIPPGCPHEGYAIEPSLNYSIGFRAPNQQDLLSAFADFALQEECFKQRYADPNLTLRDNISQINTGEIAQIKELILSTVSDKSKLELFLGRYLSQAKHDLNIQPIEPAYEPEDLIELLEQAQAQAINWFRLGGLRCIFIDTQLFINGESVELNSAQMPIAQLIATQEEYSAAELIELTNNPDALNLLLALVNEGFIFIDADEAF